MNELILAMRFILFFAVLIIFIAACSVQPGFRKDKPEFDASHVITRYKSVADLNDAYFEIRENNFFEFYRQLFDSVKNTSYPGTFTRTGDTMHLKFYNKKGREVLGSKALLNPAKKEIIFFDQYHGVKSIFTFN